MAKLNLSQMWQAIWRAKMDNSAAKQIVNDEPIKPPPYQPKNEEDRLRYEALLKEFT